MSATATKINIQPLDDRVVVEPIDQDDQTPGGIYLPDSAKEKPQEGRVLAVGPGKLLDNGNRAQMAVSVGQRVLFSKYGGTELKYAQQTVKILSERDLLGIITE